MAGAKGSSDRVTIRVSDPLVKDWLAAQENVSYSMRMLVRQFVTIHGYNDVGLAALSQAALLDRPSALAAAVSQPARPAPMPRPDPEPDPDPTPELPAPESRRNHINSEGAAAPAANPVEASAPQVTVQEVAVDTAQAALQPEPSVQQAVSQPGPSEPEREAPSVSTPAPRRSLPPAAEAAPFPRPIREGSTQLDMDDIFALVPPGSTGGTLPASHNENGAAAS